MAVELLATAPSRVPFTKISKLSEPSLDTAILFQEPEFIPCVLAIIGSLFASPERNSRSLPSMLKSTEPSLDG